MSNLDLVEAASGGPLVMRHLGETFTLAEPAAMPYQHVLYSLRTLRAPDVPRPMAEWKQERVFERWCAHFDLPEFASAQRLAYLIDHYRSALVYDLQVHAHGVDLGELWRARRWRTLLDIIDHLPAHSWYSSAVSTDEEHAKMIAESLAARESEGEQTPSGPPLHTWTPEVAALTTVIDCLRSLEHTLAAVNGNKGERPKPMPRPGTPLEGAIKRAKHAARKAQHDALTLRLLPHKRKQAEQQR